MVLSFYKGPIAPRIDGIDISFIVGLISASVAYALSPKASNSIPKSAQSRSETVLHNGAEAQTA